VKLAVHKAENLSEQLAVEKAKNNQLERDLEDQKEKCEKDKKED
jgi:hypothetical protein